MEVKAIEFHRIVVISLSGIIKLNNFISEYFKIQTGTLDR